ncbi:MAG TPA: CoB--CoM heterodisulfide reductase iron-sulfur subunit A family protein [Candidatus Bathyarchaeia archaeon]|nr:CoB--CoM heterodisulfide reductase iron-sulfur subunit A family protein [Candidatus Bathyarchaeia archaeon]
MSGADEPKIGVYICHCGVNISATVDVEDVAKYASSLPNVALAKHYMYMCSAPAQAMIRNDIKEHGLTRVIVASCSPRMHELTFRRVVEEGGLNPYLFDMTNIREHCSWVHPEEPQKATKKAKDLIRMSVARAALLEPLQKRIVEVTVRALVVGAGIAGLRSALDLAERGFEVYLVEKEPVLGGRMTQLNKVYPTGDYALDLLKPLIGAVVPNPKITVLTSSKLTAVDGYIGNFKAKIFTNPRHVNEKCDACGKCVAVCPVEVSNDFDFGLGKRKAIYLPFPDAVPHRYTVDHVNCNKCGKCVETCDKGAIDLNQQPTESEVDVGTIIVAIGHDLYEPSKGEFGYKAYDNVITTGQLERLLNQNGPTRGQLLRSGAPPETVVFISCVGGRQEPGIYLPIDKDRQLNRYCSRACCMTGLNNALEIKEKYPKARVYYLYRDIRTFGKGHEDFYRKAGEAGVVFMRYRPEAPPVVSNELGSTVVTVQDMLTSNETISIPADYVVLNVSMVPRAEALEVQGLLKIAKGVEGFFTEAHAKLRPLDTPTDGIFLAGTAQGPKDITDSAAMGSAAAARASVPLAKGKVELEPVVAYVELDKCDGCAMCVEPCTFKAITIVEHKEGEEVKKRAFVNEALCKGCGACAATCPPKAIYVKHFTLEQIAAMINALLAE